MLLRINWVKKFKKEHIDWVLVKKRTLVSLRKKCAYDSGVLGKIRSYYNRVIGKTNDCT